MINRHPARASASPIQNTPSTVAAIESVTRSRTGPASVSANSTGTKAAKASRTERSSPTAAAALKPSATSSFVSSSMKRVSTACAAHTPAKQSACSSRRTEPDLGPVAVPTRPSVPTRCCT